MKGFVAAVAIFGAAYASPVAQSAGASSGTACVNTYPGTFTINNVLTSKRQAVTVTLTLNNGVLTDQAGRIGYIAANRQFQFDNPIQAGAVITSGWQVCQNGHLSLGGKDTFFQCQSGNFYNLYDQTQGAQCQPIYITVSAAGSSSSAPAATGTAKVTQITDGQVQATSAKVTQISDGQVQATSAKTSAKITQISDGQIQATSAAKITQISDGQIQATSAKTSASAKITQISDGQIQATSAKTSASAKITQISDGQIQATSAASAKITQISDGQIQATSARPAPATFTGAAAQQVAGSFAFVAGIVGAVALL